MNGISKLLIKNMRKKFEDKHYQGYLDKLEAWKKINPRIAEKIKENEDRYWLNLGYRLCGKCGRPIKQQYTVCYSCRKGGQSWKKN